MSTYNIDIPHIGIIWYFLINVNNFHHYFYRNDKSRFGDITEPFNLLPILYHKFRKISREPGGDCSSSGLFCYRKIGRNHLRNSTPQKLSFFRLILLYGKKHENTRAWGILMGAPGWFIYSANFDLHLTCIYAICNDLFRFIRDCSMLQVKSKTTDKPHNCKVFGLQGSISSD